MKMIVGSLVMMAGTAAVAQLYNETGFVEPSAWTTNGWDLNTTNGYMFDGTTMWPVQVADLGTSPGTNNLGTSIALDSDISDRLWFYRQSFTPEQYATHTPYRRLNFELVNVVTDPGVNFDGPDEGPDAAYDLGDTNAFTTLFNAGDLAADLNGDGVLDLNDITAFSSRFNAATLKVEHRIGWVQDGMWVGVDPDDESDFPAAQPYFDVVDEFVNVRGYWDNWNYATTSGTTTTESDNVRFQTLESGALSPHAVTYDTSSYNSAVRLLNPPDGTHERFVATPVVRPVGVRRLEGRL